MVEHQRNAHTREEDKKFQCDNCDKRFITKDKLKIHQMNVHIKARPYSCRYNCGGMDYNDKSNRNQHEKKKHGSTWDKQVENCGQSKTHQVEEDKDNSIDVYRVFS